MILQSYLGIEYNGERTPLSFKSFVDGINDLNLGIPPQQDDENYSNGYQSAFDMRIFIRITENGKTQYALEETPGDRYQNKLMAIKASRFPRSATLDETEHFIYMRFGKPGSIYNPVLCSANNGNKWHPCRESALRHKYHPLPEGYVYQPLSWKDLQELEEERRKEGRHNLQNRTKKPKSKLKRASIL